MRRDLSNEKFALEMLVYECRTILDLFDELGPEKYVEHGLDKRMSANKEKIREILHAMNEVHREEYEELIEKHNQREEI